MTTPHPLSKFFQPEHILLIGASERQYSLGERILSALLRGGFLGRITPINPRHKQIGGIKAFPNINRVPEYADTAWIVTMPDTYDAIFKACYKKQIPHIIVMQNWDNFNDSEWQLAQNAIFRGKQAGLHIIALNTSGLTTPAARLHGSVYTVPFSKGDIALVGCHSEFSALINPILQQAGIGISHHIGLHPKLTPECSAGILDYLAEDKQTKLVIIEYQPAQNLRELFSALRHCARKKPLILHCNHYADTREQAILHHLAGRCGFLPTFTPEELFTAIHALSSNKLPASHLHLIANEACGWLQRRAEILDIDLRVSNDNRRPAARHNGYIGSNPSITHYRGLAHEHLESKHTHALLAVIAPTPDGAESGITTALAQLQNQSPKPLIISSPHARGLMQFSTSEQAMQAFHQHQRYHCFKQQLIQTAKPLPAYVKTPGIQAASTQTDIPEKWLKSLYLPEYNPATAPLSDGLNLILERNRYGFVLYAEKNHVSLAFLPPFNTMHADTLIHTFNLKRQQKNLYQWLHSLNEATDKLHTLQTLHINIGQQNTVTKLDFSSAPDQADNVLSPYPDQTSHIFTLKNGGSVFIRPIRPEDAEAEQQYVRNLSEKSRQTRFMAHIKELNPTMLANFCNLDYRREAAFAAEDENGILLGISRYSCNRFPESCEFGISVAENMHGQGLAYHLMQQILSHAATQGYRSMTAEILKSNVPMLKLAEKLGFHIRPSPHEGEICEAERPLLPPEHNTRRKHKQ